MNKFLSHLTGQKDGSGTHAHIIGASGSGKSRYLESLIRDALYEDMGFCLIDWHGPVYEGTLSYLSYHQTTHRDIYLLDPANGDFITPYNPFRSGARNPVSAANSFIDALAKTWGSQDTNSTPRIEQIARLLFLICVVSGESLSNVALMLREERSDVRRWAWRILSDPSLGFMRLELEDFAGTDPRKWNDHVSSTIRRLGRLLADPAVFRFFNLGQSLDLRKLMDDGAIILVNLASRGVLDRTSARAFASLLMADLFNAAMLRSVDERPNPFILFMDEFHEYMTPDTPSMLEGVRKGGLHLVMAHQHLEQLDRLEQKSVRASVLQNTGIKVCFQQNDPESAKFIAEQMFFHELTEDKIKDEIRRWETVGQVLEKHQVRGVSLSQNTGGSHATSHWDGEPTPRTTDTANESEIVTGTLGTALLLRNILEFNVSNRTFYSPEEKLRQVANRLMSLNTRQYFIRYSPGIPESQITPNIEHYDLRPDLHDEYIGELAYMGKALSPNEADHFMSQSQAEFISKIRPPKKEKKPKSPPADPSPSAPTQKPF